MYPRYHDHLFYTQRKNQGYSSVKKPSLTSLHFSSFCFRNLWFIFISYLDILHSLQKVVVLIRVVPYLDITYPDNCRRLSIYLLNLISLHNSSPSLKLDNPSRLDKPFDCPLKLHKTLLPS